MINTRNEDDKARHPAQAARCETTLTCVLVNQIPYMINTENKDKKLRHSAPVAWLRMVNQNRYIDQLIYPRVYNHDN